VHHSSRPLVLEKLLFEEANEMWEWNRFEKPDNDFISDIGNADK
jgi:hypothetical protein